MDEEGNHDPFKHMAQMVGFLGPPPKDFVPRSETTSQCFDPEGKLAADSDSQRLPVSLCSKI